MSNTLCFRCLNLFSLFLSRIERGCHLDKLFNSGGIVNSPVPFRVFPVPSELLPILHSYHNTLSDKDDRTYQSTTHETLIKSFSSSFSIVLRFLKISLFNSQNHGNRGNCRSCFCCELETRRRSFSTKIVQIFFRL